MKKESLLISFEGQDVDRLKFEIKELLEYNKINSSFIEKEVEGTMGTDLIGILEILAGSTTLTVLITNIFKTVNLYFSTKLNKYNIDTNRDKIILTREKEGEKISFEINKNNYEELNKILKSLKIDE